MEELRDAQFFQRAGGKTIGVCFTLATGTSRPLPFACTTEACTADLPADAKGCVSEVATFDGP